jgi:DNA-binding PadR family transcriptional regulator
MPKTLGEFELTILLALLHLRDEEAYGVTIRRAIESRTGRSISSGAIYTALDRLDSQGLVSSWTSEPTAERGGRRKRLFRIEAAGRAALSRSVRTFRAMSAGLFPTLETGERE